MKVLADDAALTTLVASKRRRTVIAVVYGMVLAGFVIGAPVLSEVVRGKLIWLDFSVYYVGGEVFRNGGDLYGELPTLPSGIGLPFTYPPIAAAIFSVFTVMPWYVAAFLFVSASAALLTWSLRLIIGRLVTADNATLWYLTAIAGTVTMFLAPVMQTFLLAQINIVLMAMILLDALVLTSKRSKWRGLLIGLAIAIKLTPAVFGIYFLIRRDWRGAAGVIAGFALATGFGHVLAPSASTQYWTETISDPSRVGGLAYFANQSINGVIARTGVEDGTRSVLWLALSVVIGVVFWWFAWRLHRQGHEVAALLAVASIALLCSPVSWDHHFVWLAPLLLVLADWARRPGAQSKWGVLLAVGLFLSLARLHALGKHSTLQDSVLAQLTGALWPVWLIVTVMAMGLSAPAARRRPTAAETPVKPS